MKPVPRRAVLLLGLWALSAGSAPAGAAPLLVQDLQRLYRPASLGLMAAALAGAGIAHPWDNQVEGPLVDAAVLRRGMDLGNAYGSGLNALSVSAGSWVLARVAHRPLLQATASELARSLVLASSMVMPLKRMTGRWRPDHSNRRSFPSGHSGNAFAMSTVLARRYGVRAGVPLYVLAALTSLARIQDRRHHLSDVVAGGMLGVAAGWAVTHAQVRVAWVPTFPAGGWGIEVRIASS